MTVKNDDDVTSGFLDTTHARVDQTFPFRLSDQFDEAQGEVGGDVGVQVCLKALCGGDKVGSYIR